jgi:hypothetical protein
LLRLLRLGRASLTLERSAFASLLDMSLLMNRQLTPILPRIATHPA